MHIAPENFIEVADVIEAGQSCDFADAVLTPGQKVSADGNTVEIQIIGQSHPGYRFKETAEMAFAYVNGFGYFPETDGAAVVFLQIGENRFDVVSSPVCLRFRERRRNGTGGKRVPYFQKAGLDQQLEARRFLCKEIPDGVEESEKLLLPKTVRNNVFRETKAIFENRSDIFSIDIVAAGTVQKGGGEDEGKKAEVQSGSLGRGVESARGNDEDITFLNFMGTAGDVHPGATSRYHKNFQFFVPVTPDALLHPEGGGYFVESNGKKGSSMIDRFMESRKIVQRMVLHSDSL